MPRTRSRPVSDGTLDTYDLSSPRFSLNLAAPRYRLGENEVEEALGVNLVEPDEVSPVRNRVPVGTSIPVADRPLTCAVAVRAKSLVSNTLHIVKNDDLLAFESNGNEVYTPTDGLITRVGDFAGYNYRPGDHLLVNFPVALRGSHRVYEKVSDDAIRISPGLASGKDSINLTEAILAQGKGTHDQVVYKEGPNSLGMALVKSHDSYKEEGPWTGSFVDALIHMDEDRRATASYKTGLVTGLVTYAREDDALLYSGPASGSFAGGAYSKFTVTRQREATLEGILVSNGRKFWLLRNGAYELLLDLNDDVFLGTVWRFARIATNRFMVVSPKFAPRIIHLSRKQPVVFDEGEALAGCVAPRKLNEVLEESTVDVPSWVMFYKGDEGSLAVGDYRVKVRGVNLEDALVSEFVDVVPVNAMPTGAVMTTGVADSLQLTTNAQNDGISVWTCLNRAGVVGGNYGFTPSLQSRITHIEVWRSNRGGRTYYLETRIAINSHEGNEKLFDDPAWAYLDPDPETYPVQLSDVDLLNLPVLTSSEEVAGGLPPMCRDVVSLLKVTLCFGRADADRVNPILYARNFFSSGGEYHPDDDIDPDRIEDVTANTFDGLSPGVNANVYEGDQVVVTFGGTTGTEFFPKGIYDIDVDYHDEDGQDPATKDFIALDNDDGNITFPTNSIGDGESHEKLHYYIRRPFTIKWPVIESDEDVWYSRTDKFNPEGFPPRVLQLSNAGDIFRRAVCMEDRVLVVMDQGVHLLYLDKTELLKETLAHKAMGTPWPDSVVLYEDLVLWATPDGIRSVSTQVTPDENGKRGLFNLLGGTSLRNWFREAFDNGESVDAGIDTRNFILRFRRKKADHTYQTLACDLRSNRWTLIDDDNGIAFAASAVAGSPPLPSPALYSVDGVTGAAFELDRRDADPYSDLLVEGTLVSSDKIKTTKIRRSGAAVFSSVLVGEIVRFSNGAIRTILAADGNSFSFDTVYDLAEGDEFSIGPLRFRVRYAPIHGRVRRGAKTVQGVLIRARRRGGSEDSGEELTVRLYRDYSDTAFSFGTVPVFNDEDVGKTSEDRVVSVEADGVAVQLEIENLKARKSFDLELVEVDMYEGLDARVDVEE